MTQSAFKHLEHREISALQLDFHSYVHHPTGARHFHLECNDTNNAFMVAFPTLPTDSTGVAHMLEHTTLCGSRRYPVRDPFFMMLRRSLNTFMNAFTSSDSTAYPFATQNRKDFDNLLAVYLDAVFFPTLDPLDFAQEGWRVDFETPDDESQLVYKGVVYNEMKGAMSAPSSQLWQQLHHSIFPDTVYRHNSGGEPTRIPDLSYEQLRAFHAKHYHPSHAIFMTYGNFPIEDHQAAFEILVLNEFSSGNQPLKVASQPRFDVPVTATHSYAISELDQLARGTHAVWGWLLGPSADARTLLEGHLLAAILLDHGGSPLRQYLETTDLADAPSELCGLDDSARELVFCCGVEGTEPEHIERLNHEILELLAKVAIDGVEEEILVGIVDHMEMAQRDIGGGGYPYGLQLMGRVLPAALYDGEPAALLDIDDVLLWLRERIKDTSYIPGLINEQLVNNPHRARIAMRPDEHKLKRDHGDERKRLASMLSELNAESRNEIRLNSQRLVARQDEVQDANLLPKVTLADVPRTIPIVTGHEVGDAVAHHYVAATNGLCYVQVVLELPQLSADELMQLPLFCEYLTELGSGAENYLDTQGRRALVGDIGAHASARATLHDSDLLNGRLVISAKGLARHQNDLVENLFEVLDEVRFDEMARIQDLVAQSRVDVEASITDRGHQLAMCGAARSLSVGGRLDDLWSGPANTVFVQKMDRECQTNDENIARIAGSFGRIRQKLFSAPWRFLVVGEDEVVSSSLAQLSKLTCKLGANGDFHPLLVTRPDTQADGAWVTNTQVNFCAKAYTAVPDGHDDAAALAVLAKYLQDGFLHPAIREKGGAYGAGAQFDGASATFRLFSYRDPRLGETLEDFDRSLDWLATSNDAQRLEESILGVIRGLDSPRPPAGAAIHDFYSGLDGRLYEFKVAHREAVLQTTFDQILGAAQRYLIPATAKRAVITHAGHQKELEQLELEELKL